MPSGGAGTSTARKPRLAVPYALVVTDDLHLPPTQSVDSAGRSRRRWGIVVAVFAVAAVLAAAVVGIRGLFASPIAATRPDGTVVIAGTWEPYRCSGCPDEGYVQAGARSVFVVLPGECPAPSPNTSVRLVGRPDPSIGRGGYRAVECPQPE